MKRESHVLLTPVVKKDLSQFHLQHRKFASGSGPNGVSAQLDVVVLASELALVSVCMPVTATDIDMVVVPLVRVVPQSVLWTT
jgi:hypothetical protein